MGRLIETATNMYIKSRCTVCIVHRCTMYCSVDTKSHVHRIHLQKYKTFSRMSESGHYTHDLYMAGQGKNVDTTDQVLMRL